ncbi:MAG TPA: TlpA disulfide reductase family protein [Candidatus Limnocylindrales bacterium]
MLLLARLGGGPGSESSRAAVGSVVPPLVGTTLDGQPFDLASLRGRPVIVNFWASWCVPCRTEFPLLKASLSAHTAEGLTIVGVLFKDDAAPAAQFVAQQGAGWPTLLDPNGSFASAYRVVAPPQTYFVDRAGVLRYRQIGELLSTDLERHLPDILGGPA